ncbi:MAG: hypothetical protein Kow00107_03860 [Planctomycetota bacterium]
MNLEAVATSVVVSCLAGYAAFTGLRYRRLWSSVTALSFLAAGMTLQSMGVLGSPEWRFSEFSNALHMAAGWAPLCVAASALFAYVAYATVLKTAPIGKSFWFACIALCGVSAYFAWKGRIDHPVESFFSAAPISWLLAIVGAGVILTADFVKLPAEAEESGLVAEVFRRAVYGDALWITASAAIVGWFGQHSASGFYAFTAPVFMFSAGLAALALNGYLGSRERRIPFAFIYLIIWAIAWGGWLEFA